MSFAIDQTTTVLFENTRTRMLKEVLQKTTSDLSGYATVLPNSNGDYVKVPFISNSKVKGRTQRHEDIVATELTYNVRGIKPLLYSDWHKLSKDDPHFMRDLPITCTNVVNQIRPAIERAKDENLMGTILDESGGSPTEGEYIIRTSTTVDGGATDGSPYKMGTTTGIFGDAYIGKTGEAKASLPLQPYIDNTGLTTNYDEYDETVALDFKKSNVVPVNYTGTGTSALTGWTLEKFILLHEMMQARYATRRGQIVHAITHRQAADILRNEKFQNVLFGNQVLKTGLIDGLFGIKFLVTDCLPIVDIGSGKYARACPCWLVEDLAFSVWDNARFQIREPQEKEDTVLVGAQFGMGSGRLREETVIVMMCDEGFKGKGG